MPASEPFAPQLRGLLIKFGAERTREMRGISEPTLCRNIGDRSIRVLQQPKPITQSYFTIELLNTITGLLDK